jgi:hypothetical protein
VGREQRQSAHRFVLGALYHAQLYDRTGDEITLDEVERIVI